MSAENDDPNEVDAKVDQADELDPEIDCDAEELTRDQELKDALERLRNNPPRTKFTARCYSDPPPGGINP